MSIYHHDFYTWTHEQATLLKEGRLNELDIEHLIEELEDMGTPGSGS
jgi:Fe-S cluster biosynthesis and repair protein YggX